MCERICKTCGGDDRISKIGEAMGFRPDIAFQRIRKLEDVLQRLVDLKSYKDKHGKTNQYTTAKLKAWEEAREILSK